MPEEILYYIYSVKCKRLFSLAWYDNSTYAPQNSDKAGKSLPTFYYNRSSCKSKKLIYLHQDLFVHSNHIKYLETDRK